MSKFNLFFIAFFMHANSVLAEAIEFSEIEDYIVSLNIDSTIKITGFLDWDGNNNVKRVMYHLYATPEDSKRALYSDVIVLMGASQNKKYYDLSMCKGNYIEVQGTVSIITNPQNIIYNLQSIKVIDKLNGNKKECLQYFSE